jgi:hypothetical protein
MVGQWKSKSGLSRSVSRNHGDRLYGVYHMACINHHFFYFPEKSTGAFVTTMHGSNVHQNDSDNGIPDTRGTGNRKKYETQDGFETGSSFEGKFNSCVGIKTFHTQTSRHAEPEVNALDYSEGWQERLLEKAKEMKAKSFAETTGR